MPNTTTELLLLDPLHREGEGEEKWLNGRVDLWTLTFFKVEAIFRIFGILSKLKIAHFGFFKQDESFLNRSTKKYKTSNVIEVDEFIYRNREGLVRGGSVQFVRVDGKIYRVVGIEMARCSRKFVFLLTC